MRVRWLVSVAALAVFLAGCGSSGTDHAAAPAGRPSSTVTPAASSAVSTSPPASSFVVPRQSVPRPDHIVLVVLENISFDQVVGRPEAPFLDSLERRGAVFTRSFAITHPSQPNYLALFSGSTQGVTDDSCPHTFGTANLGRELIDAGESFVGYAEDLPAAGYRGCSYGRYARKHNPWVDFSDLPESVDQPMTAFPADFAALPTVSVVVPNLDHDVHDGTLSEADRWLQVHLGVYVTWASKHNSLLVITSDEDDFTAVNRIATIMVGAHVRPGRYAGRIDHYTVLRTIEAAYGLAPLGASAQVKPITAIWSR